MKKDCVIEPSANIYEHVMFNSEILKKNIFNPNDFDFIVRKGHHKRIVNYLRNDLKANHLKSVDDINFRSILRLNKSYENIYLLTCTPRNLIKHVLLNPGNIHVFLHSLVATYNNDIRFKKVLDLALLIRINLLKHLGFSPINFISQTLKTGEFGKKYEFRVINHGMIIRENSPKKKTLSKDRFLFIGEQNVRKNFNLFVILSTKIFADRRPYVLSSKQIDYTKYQLENIVLKDNEEIIDMIHTEDIIFCAYQKKYYEYILSGTLMEAISVGCKVVVFEYQLGIIDSFCEKKEILKEFYVGNEKLMIVQKR